MMGWAHWSDCRHGKNILHSCQIFSSVTSFQFEFLASRRLVHHVEQHRQRGRAQERDGVPPVPASQLRLRARKSQQPGFADPRWLSLVGEGNIPRYADNIEVKLFFVSPTCNTRNWLCLFIIELPEYLLGISEPNCNGLNITSLIHIRTEWWI